MDLLHLWHEYRGIFLILVTIVSIVAIASKRPQSATSSATEQDDEKPHSTKNADNQDGNKPKIEQKTRMPTAPMAVDFTTATTQSGPKKKSRSPKRFTAGERTQKIVPLPSVNSKMKIFYSTLTGSSKRYAEIVYKRMGDIMESQVELINLDYVDDLDDYFVSPNKKELTGTIYLLVIPSYETESPLDYFIESLKETYNDFRIDSKPLQLLGGFSVFGLGDKEGWPEEDKFCYQARLVDKYLGKLGCKRVFPWGSGCVKTDASSSVEEWLTHLVDILQDPSPPEEPDIVDSDDELEEESNGNDVVDVEEMGGIIKRSKEDKKLQLELSESGSDAKEMVAKDSPTYKSLTKQGYTIVGSHSGVKICRWTKSALRGRGSCYKKSLYGIESHLCMETTPSLSCSSKCVFCWRHGTNPVGTSWRWQVNKPEEVLQGAMEGHYKMIKQMRGVPGVRASRFAEAFRIRHCALSLVGEALMYPYINEFVKMLHERHISSFLVCNAQHPEQLQNLGRVTQLYVSIDASNKEDLKRVDRPLFRDFWERLEQCLDILRSHWYQRTVFRLTLVKDYNFDDTEGYADMVERARPCFIEVKGVTYCGTSKDNQLSIKNSPFYEEVKSFVERLNDSINQREGMEYEVAAEHAHSCCVLIAQKRFKINGVWHTHIDYDRFYELLESGEEFGPMDYTAPTPEWAWYGNGGFDPADVRHVKGKPKAPAEDAPNEPKIVEQKVDF